MNHDFEDIEVKENALELLEDALRRKRKPCMIGTGSMSDPYIPLEIKTEHTRRALLLIEKYGCDNLWVVADNERAIHVYEKLGFRMEKPTMFSMVCNGA